MKQMPEGVRVQFKIYLKSVECDQVVVVTTNDYNKLDLREVSSYIRSNVEGWIKHLNENWDVTDFRRMTEKEVAEHRAANIDHDENTDIRH